MSVSMDVNSLAQQIKDVTLNAATAVKDAVVGESAAADDKYRVFVGNLNSETTEDEIRSLFTQAGEIVSLPTRRNYRTKTASPSGIAFVGFTSDAEAQKAVETLNGKTLGDREINVAIARPLSQKKPKAESAPRDTSTSEDTKETSETAETSDSPAAEKKKRARKPKNPVAHSKTNGVESTDQTTEEGDAAATKTRAPRAPREKGPPADGVPSATTLFVAGLDYRATDADLKELFAKFDPVNAHVALRPIPRFMIKKLAEKGEQRLGRGFGFVTFANQESQKAALKAMDGQKSGDKELAVKVAVDAPEKVETTSSATAEIAA